MTVTPERLARLTGVAAIIVAVWLMFGLFSSSEGTLRLDPTSNDAWNEVLLYQLTVSLVWAVFTPVAIFIAERLPLRKPHQLRNLALLLVIAPLFAVVRSAVGGAVLELCEHGRVSAAFVWLSVTLRFHRNTFLFLVVVGVVNVVLMQRASAERERNALALRAALMNAELHRLRTSMQPRLMFATLDSIAAKIREQPAVADRMLVELGHLLRALLEIGKRPTVRLAQELELIDRYFDLERLRTGGRFTARVDVDEELLGAEVPPLRLHTVVASALLDRREPPQHIDIRGRRLSGDRLVLGVRYESTEDMDGAPRAIEWRRTGTTVVAELAFPLAASEATA